MNFQQSDLDLMKREREEFGVAALLTPEALRLLIADLEEARAEEATSRRLFYEEQDKRQSAEYRLAEAREHIRSMGEAMDRGSGF